MAAPEFDPQQIFGTGEPEAKRQPNVKASGQIQAPGGARSVAKDTVSQFAKSGSKRQKKDLAIEEELFPILNELIQDAQQVSSQEFRNLPKDMKTLKRMGVSRRARQQIMFSRAQNPFFDQIRESNFEQRKLQRLSAINTEIRGLIGVIEGLDPVGRASVDAMIETQLDLLKVADENSAIKARMQSFTQRTQRQPTFAERQAIEEQVTGQASPAVAMKNRADGIKALSTVAPSLTEEEFKDPIYDPFRGSMKLARKRYDEENKNKPLEEFMTPDNLNGLYEDQFTGHLESLRRFVPLLGSVREGTGEGGQLTGENAAFAAIFGKPGGLSLSMRALPATDNMRRRAKVKALFSLRELVSKIKGDFALALQRMNVITDDTLMEELQGYTDSTPAERRIQDASLIQQEADSFNQFLLDQREQIFNENGAK